MSDVSQEQLAAVNTSIHDTREKIENRLREEVRLLEDKIDSSSKSARNEAIAVISSLGTIGAFIILLASMLGYWGIQDYIKKVVDVRTNTWIEEAGLKLTELGTILTKARAQSKDLTDTARRNWVLGCAQQICLAVDSTGEIYQSDPKTQGWTKRDKLKDFAAPFSISCTEQNLCWIVDAKGNSLNLNLHAPETTHTSMAAFP